MPDPVLPDRDVESPSHEHGDGASVILHGSRYGASPSPLLRVVIVGLVALVVVIVVVVTPDRSSFGGGGRALTYSDTTYDEKYRTENPDVNVAWIMTYPGSGGSYLSDLRHAATQDARPSSYYYLQTHCGGVGGSSDTPPADYVLTPKTFVKTCLDTARFTLDRTLVRRMVHAYRNPLDNVVARYRQQAVTNDQSTPASFHAWCHDNDRRFVEEESQAYSAEAVRLSATIPCHAEFFQYVQWHNNVVAMKNFLELYTHTVHYGSFRVNLEHTARHFWRFLGLVEQDGVAAPLPDVPEFRFESFAADYYDDEERHAIGSFLREFASVETWLEIARYFPTVVVDKVVVADETGGTEEEGPKQ